MQHEPGKGFSYNNSGYYVAGLLIEKVTGKSYEEIIRNYIFEPLGMKNSGFDYNNLPGSLKATGHQYLNSTGSKVFAFVDSTVGYSAGGIYSTAGDMFKWARTVADGGIISEKSWYMAFTPVAGDYGLGFRINNFFGKNYIRHSGGYPGFVSEFVYYPESGVTIILLKNSGTYGEDVWPVAMGLTSIMHDLPYDNWKVRNAVKPSAQVLQSRAGKYFAKEIEIEFIVRENQLVEKLPNGMELPLLAESDDVYYLGNFNTSFHFRKENGKDVVVIHEHGSDFTLKKK